MLSFRTPLIFPDTPELKKIIGWLQELGGSHRLYWILDAAMLRMSVESERLPVVDSGFLQALEPAPHGTVYCGYEIELKIADNTIYLPLQELLRRMRRNKRYDWLVGAVKFKYLLELDVTLPVSSPQWPAQYATPTPASVTPITPPPTGFPLPTTTDSPADTGEPVIPEKRKKEVAEEPPDQIDMDCMRQDHSTMLGVTVVTAAS